MTRGRLLLAVLLVAATGLVGWRVLRPAEVQSSGAIPPAVSVAPGVTGRVSSPPLLVAGRLRVFVSKRQVRADGPVSLKTTYTPSWSLRRWPEQLAGVVAAGTIVVSRWSDGLLVAIDGLTGRELWRAAAPAGGGFTDARTTVWSPPGLSATADAIEIKGSDRTRVLDATTGAEIPRTSGVASEQPRDVQRVAPGEAPSVRFDGSETTTLGEEAGATYLLTADRYLVCQDTATKRERYRFKLAYGTESTDWTPVAWQLRDGYLAIDRGTEVNREYVLIAKL